MGAVLLRHTAYWNGAALEYYWRRTSSSYEGWYGVGGMGLIVVGLRCLWYAITGKDNINRDDF